MQEPSTPDISIVTPVYNTGELLLETAESVLSQSYGNWEWLIVDDGSEAATVEIVRQLAGRDPRISVQFQENRGGSAARNQGLNLARGKYIKFLDSDDLISPALLEDQMRAMEAEGQRICLSPHCTLIQKRGQTKQTELTSKSGSLYPDDILLLHLSVGTGHPAALMFETSLVNEIGGWDESLHRDQDGDTLVRAALVHRTYSWVPTSYSIYRNHDFCSRISQGYTFDKMSSRVKVLDRLVSELAVRLELDSYKDALAALYDLCGRHASVDYPEISQYCFRQRDKLSPEFVLQDPWPLKLLRSLFGVRGAEIVKRWYREGPLGR